MVCSRAGLAIAHRRRELEVAEVWQAPSVVQVPGHAASQFRMLKLVWPEQGRPCHVETMLVHSRLTRKPGDGSHSAPSWKRLAGFAMTKEQQLELSVAR